MNSGIKTGFNNIIDQLEKQLAQSKIDSGRNFE